VEVGFSGWSAEAVEFYRGLEADNTKADQVAGVLRTAAPLHQWLDHNVGPAEG
jgi:hypothetical protein